MSGGHSRLTLADLRAHHKVIVAKFQAATDMNERKKYYELILENQKQMDKLEKLQGPSAKPVRRTGVRRKTRPTLMVKPTSRLTAGKPVKPGTASRPKPQTRSTSKAEEEEPEKRKSRAGILFFFLIAAAVGAVYLYRQQLLDLYEKYRGKPAEPAPVCGLLNPKPLPDNASLKSYPITSFHYLDIEAEDADSIEPSFEADYDPGCSGGKFLNHPEGTGSKWAESGIGSASYSIGIPETGNYTFWARVKWESGCSNAFDLFIDETEPSQRKGVLRGGKGIPLEMFGKQTTLDTWHWESDRVFHLEKGTHTIRIENHDDGIGIDAFLLTDDPSFEPAGTVKWRYRKTFSAVPEGWRYDLGSWKTGPDAAGTFLFEKTAEQASPAFLESAAAETCYIRAVLKTSHAVHVYLNYRSPSDYLLVELSKEHADLVTRSGSKGSASCFTGSQEIIPEERECVIEVFRKEDSIAVTVGSRLINIFKAPNAEKGSIGFDVCQTGYIREIYISPFEDIHVGDNFYYTSCPSPVSVISGKWSKTGSGIRAGAGESMAGAGKPYWQDYQVTCMLTPPEAGTCGIGVYAKDAENMYLFEMEGSRMMLSLLESGEKRVLAEKNTEGPVPGKPNRVTVNRVGEDIQVFCNGVELFRKKDDTFYSGYMVFTSALPASQQGEGTKKKSQPRGVLIDDIEIRGIKNIHNSVRNEEISWFTSHRARIINTVLDSYGATGGFQPGDYSNQGTEPFLRKLTGKLTGREVSEEARIWDFQWVDFEQTFIPRNGLSKEAGFMTAKSFEPGKKHYLWALETLHGDWDLQFDVTGQADEIGCILIDAESSLTEGRLPEKPHLEVLLSPNRKTVTIKEKESFSTELPWEYRKNHQVNISRSNGVAVVSLDGKVIVSMYVDQDNALKRFALCFSNGFLKLDNIMLRLHPDLIYDFDNNKPYTLALSDWETDFSKSSHGGSYYGYLRLEKKDGVPSLLSKRSWTGDFTMAVLLDLSKEQDTLVELRDPDSGMSPHSIQITKDEILYLLGNKVLEQKAELNNFSVENRRLTTIWLTLRNSILTVRLTDAEGTGRPVLSVKPQSLPESFNVYIQGDPRLELKEIRIWGTEAKKSD